MGCFERTVPKHVYYLGWNGSPVQAGCMRQVLGPCALGRPRRIRWRGRWEGGSGWGIHVNPRLIHVNVWQKPLQYCKVISLQLIKINEKKKKEKLTIGIKHIKILSKSSYTFVNTYMHTAYLAICWTFIIPFCLVKDKVCHFKIEAELFWLPGRGQTNIFLYTALAMQS